MVQQSYMAIIFWLQAKADAGPLMPTWQAYSLLYYDTRVKYVVVKQWPAVRDRLLEKKAKGEDIGKDPPKAAGPA
jgi:hypothetical protein